MNADRIDGYARPDDSDPSADIEAMGVTRSALDTTAIAGGSGLLHDRVAETVRGLIRDGTLRPGDRAPSLRRVRQRFNVSMATATRAYERLEQGGWLEARPQSGFFVRIPRGLDDAPPARGEPSRRPEAVDAAALVRTLVSADGDTPDAVTLSLALPDDALLPTRALQRSMARVARTAPVTASRYAFAPGLEALRRPVAYRAGDAGCRVHPDEVLVTSGCAEALAVALHAVTRPGGVVAVESPAFFNILTLLETLGLRALEIPADPATGLDLDALEHHLAAGEVDAVLTIANFNNPLGSCMPDAAKARLAALARDHATPVIEDDIYGELYFGERRPPLIRSFDEAGYVVTASSFSKTVAPGYRIGWLLPGAYTEAATSAKHALSVATATLPQLALADFLDTGAFDRHLRRLRRQYRDQVERMREALARHMPAGTRITDPAGGFLQWIELPPAVDGIALYHAALADGVRIAPGRLFATGPQYPNHIRVSCGMPWSEAVDAAVAKLGAAAQRLAQTATRAD